MRVIGWMLIVAGGILVIIGLATQTSIHTDMNYVPGLGLQEAKDVLNIGLMQKQMILIHIGLASFISGVIVTCFGDLKVAMRRARTAKYIGVWETEDPHEPKVEDAVTQSEVRHAE